MSDIPHTTGRLLEKAHICVYMYMCIYTHYVYVYIYTGFIYFIFNSNHSFEEMLAKVLVKNKHTWCQWMTKLREEWFNKQKTFFLNFGNIVNICYISSQLSSALHSCNYRFHNWQLRCEYRDKHNWAINVYLILCENKQQTNTNVFLWNL